MYFLKDLTAVKYALELHNGDNPIKVVVDRQERTYLIMKTAGIPSTNITNDGEIYIGNKYLVPINAHVFWLSYLVLRTRSDLPQTVIDVCSTQAMLLPGEKIELPANEAIIQLADFVRKRSGDTKGHELYRLWTEYSSSKSRWGNHLGSLQFALDVLLPAIGSSLLTDVCLALDIQPPNKGLMFDVQQNDASVALKKGKKSKITADDYKGHKSLTSFFVKRLNNDQLE